MKALKVALIVAAALVATGIITLTVAAIASGFDPTRLGNVSYIDTTHNVNEAFRSIEIDSGAADIFVVPTTDGTCRVVFHDIDSDNIVHSVSVTDGCLTIVRQDKQPLRFSFSFTAPQLTLYLPGDTYDELEVDSNSGRIDISVALKLNEAELETSSGAISATQLTVAHELEAETSSGRLYLADCTAAELRAHSSSGRVTLERMSCTDADVKTTSGSLGITDLTADGKLECESSSGAQRLEAVRCAELRAKATSGSIHADDLIASGPLAAETSSGGIRLDGCDAAELELTSSSGSIRGSLLSEKVYIATSSSGSVRVPDTRSGGVCRVRTSSGAIAFSAPAEG